MSHYQLLVHNKVLPNHYFVWIKHHPTNTIGWELSTYLEITLN